MRRPASWLAVLLLLSSGVGASAQSLAEIAEKEKQRREKLRVEKASSLDDEDPGVDSRQKKVQNGDAEPAETDAASTAPQLTNGDGGTESLPPPPSEKEAPPLQPIEADPETPAAPPAENVRSDKTQGQASLRGPVLAVGEDNSTPPPPSGEKPGTKPIQPVQPTQDFLPRDLYVTGKVYIDWFRSAFDTGSVGQLSNRVRLEGGRPAGDGWRIALDLRDRLATSGERENQFIVYDAYLTYDDRTSALSLSVGQMNLYDSAGIGTLMGGRFGYRLDSSLTVGGYGGLETNPYDLNLDPSYQKYGAFARYDGVDARSLSLSYNAIRFSGTTERQFLYATGLLPTDSVVLYGNLEFDLGSNVTQSDRLSRAFLNARFNITDELDVTANYSSGKGLDYHRFLLEQSRDPSLTSSELERFYYSTQYGARLSYLFHPRMRVFIEQRRSEQKDRMIVNDTTRLGASAYNLADTGFSFHGSYSINRGDQSESDSFRVSASRDFGPISWSTTISSSFNGIRFDVSSRQPVIIHIDNRRSISNDFFYALSRAIALSLEHEFSRQGDSSENTLFVRAMYRF